MSNPIRYALYGHDFKANPFPTYTQMRTEEPICHHPGISGDNMVWFVTNLEYADQVLRDHKRFVKSWRKTRTPEERAQLRVFTEEEELLNRHMLNFDPPDHTRLRALVNKAFTVRGINQMQDQVQTIADELLDQVQDQGSMDLIDDYAFPLPIVVICDMLGIPVNDRQRFRVWSNAFIAPNLTEEELGNAGQLLGEFIAYLREIFELYFLVKEKR
ncbi:cytochrome P450 [Chloroflexi bacterium TSY]|nr:cytochrome P450 [Chloroflexi bacterium TSY]